MMMTVLPTSSHAAGPDDASSAKPSHHVQAGFDQAKYAKDFEDWVNRFDYDWLLCKESIAKDPQRVQALLDKHEEPGLKAFFSHSVDTGPEGDRIRERLVQDAVEGLQPRSTEAAMGRLVRKELGEGFRPVGFGGTVNDAGHPAQLWYVSIGDPDNNDQQTSLLEAVFKHPHMPAYGVAERNVWLTMTFVRAHDGSLRLDSLTPEMKRFVDVLLAQMGILQKID